MASDESELTVKPNGNYLNSFVFFLEGNPKANQNTEDSRNTNIDAGDINMDSVTAEEETLIDRANGSPTEKLNKEENSDKDGSNIMGGVEESKDLDYQISENDSKSPSVATNPKKGKKRKLADTLPQRATPRRAATRNAKKYIDEDAFGELEELRESDPDYNCSDSDDDPDFDPSKKKAHHLSPELDLKGRRARQQTPKMTPKGGSNSRSSIRQSVETTDDDSNSAVRPADSNDDSLNNSMQKRRGRPPVYQTQTEKQSEEISDNTVSSTDDTTKSAGNLSSAYNYAATRTRQNQAIRLPEGPNLTDEQLKLIESQFKSGDFVMAKKDTDMMENPPIWRIDGKSLLQKFQAFEKDGKTLYRNISTYSGWTAQAKALYVPVKVNFVFQSRYDTVVELIGFKGVGGEKDNEPSQIIDKPVWIPKNKDFEITEEMRGHMPSFEIYLQTLISQALDNNFLQEIYEENDSYFVDRVRVIDDLTDERKSKILQLAKWDSKFQTSLDTWPCVNTMVTKNTEKCQACGVEDAAMLSQFYGQPYDQKTLRSKEPTIWDLDHKNFETCDSCSVLSQLYNKVAHQKYDYYSQCKSTVTNMRVSHPNKSTTNVLRDLLANDEWITGLFRSMCTTWIKVDNIYQERTSPSNGDTSSHSADVKNDLSSDVKNDLASKPATVTINDEDPDDPEEVKEVEETT